jgi:hypothetical protein
MKAMVNRLLPSVWIALVLALAFPVLVLGQTDCQTPVPSDAQTFSGDTATVTDPFTVDSGILKATGTHQGDANFIVVVTAEDGSQEFLFNEIGPYTGEKAFQVAPGSRLIADVQANGPWELVIEPAF